MFSNRFIRDVNSENPLGTGGYLAGSIAELMKDLWLGHKRAVAPWKFKKVISRFAPQFSGYSQHDSQELLVYLLDGLHEDLNLVKRKPPTKTPENTGLSDDEMSKLFWENYLKRNRSIIVDTLVG